MRPEAIYETDVITLNWKYTIDWNLTRFNKITIQLFEESKAYIRSKAVHSIAKAYAATALPSGMPPSV